MNDTNQVMTYDLAIIGAGSAAKAAVTEACRLGKSVVMIERGAPGGTCQNVGRVPSKMKSGNYVIPTEASDGDMGLASACRQA